MKEYFPTPAYVLVAYGLFYLLASCIAIDPDYFDEYTSWLLFLALPLTACEALVYWQIRERNSDRKGSWAHVWLLILGYTIIIMPFILRYISLTWPWLHMSRTRVFRWHSWLRYPIGGIMIVIAHGFFIVVRRNASSEPPADNSQPENLLDDLNA